MPGRFLRATHGASLMEYAVLVAVIGAAALASLDTLSGRVAALYATSAAALENPEIPDPEGSGSASPGDAPWGDDPVIPPPSEDDEATSPVQGGSQDDGQTGGEAEQGVPVKVDDLPPQEPDEQESMTCFGETSVPLPAAYDARGMVRLKLSGTQVGIYDQFKGRGAKEGRIVTVDGVVPLGTASEIYTVEISNVHGRGEVHTGMFARIIDPWGDILLDHSTLQRNREHGLSVGDEHILLTHGKFFIDLRGLPRGRMLIDVSDEIGDPDRGDNDGEFDFADTGCGT